MKQPIIIFSNPTSGQIAAITPAHGPTGHSQYRSDSISPESCRASKLELLKLADVLMFLSSQCALLNTTPSKSDPKFLWILTCGYFRQLGGRTSPPALAGLRSCGGFRGLFKTSTRRRIERVVRCKELEIFDAEFLLLTSAQRRSSSSCDQG